jgi:MFS superfamily sulfate permease-like transporter
MEAWVDLSLMALTFFLTLFLSVEIGIVVSVALSMVLCIRQSALMRIRILGKVSGTTNTYAPLSEVDDDDGLVGGEEEIPGVLIVRLRDVALTFGEVFSLSD